MKTTHDPLKRTWLNESPAGQPCESCPWMTQRIDLGDIFQPKPDITIFENFKLMFENVSPFVSIKQCKGE